ncbi:hypothetical protein GGS20DRAFT_554144 [Poronia punctata]|nr:hypothetical protein GGS20DRAFT_554144 [Poronia punctata]
MASYNGHRPYTASEIHLALLRPAILQILRAQGYYSSTHSTIDTLTEIAAQYMYSIAKRTAEHATMNNYLGPPGTPDVVDVRMALEECGALNPGSAPPPPPSLDEYEDTRGVDEFIRWATGRKNMRIRKIAGVVAPPTIAADVEGEDGIVEESRPTDYLDALKRKHNKTDQESKYVGTILGRSIDHGEIQIEGGPDTSIAAWMERMRKATLRPPDPEPAEDVDRADSRPPSSGLSSLADDEVDMVYFD